LTRGFLVWAWLYLIAVNCRWPLLDRGRPAITPRPRFRLSAFGTRRGWRKGRSIWCTSPPARTGTAICAIPANWYTIRWIGLSTRKKFGPH